MLETERALIVEDNEDVAYIFAEAAEEAGYATETVGTGAEALDRLEEVVPALVILDLHLPLVPGTKVLERIRRERRLAGTHVIVVTADTRLADTLHDAADLVLVKPVGYHQLRDLAARLIAKK